MQDESDIKCRNDLKENKVKTVSWYNREQSIGREANKYRDAVNSVFKNITQESEDVIPLPSLMEIEAGENQALKRWCNAELDLRVAIGHDTLQRIRQSIGLQSFYSRKQKKQTRGQNEMQNVARSQQAVSKRKIQLIKKYCRNWMCIQKLINHMHLNAQDSALRLKGLQGLSSNEDLNFFVESSQSHLPQLSWIWTVAMLDSSTSSLPQTSLQLVSEWESEGVCISCMECCILLNYKCNI